MLSLHSLWIARLDTSEVENIEDNIIWLHGDLKFLFECCKIFHMFAALTCKISLNTSREILYLQVAM